MSVLQILALARGLLELGRAALAAGKEDVEETEIDKVLASLGDSRKGLVDAIERARARDREGVQPHEPIIKVTPDPENSVEVPSDG